MSPSKVSRKTARDIAFQFLYGKAPAIENEDGIQFEQEEVKTFCLNFGQPFEPFTWELINGVAQNLSELDAAISKISAHWKLERIPLVDLTILRISGFEILKRQDIPRNVSINEAVELAKKYGEDDSASFVNGILDNIDKKS